ncbi:MAG: hypothetical protein CFE34_14200 [Rhodobacteraceae bacterium PARR1]|nr:MAG: hypothetical protein CFE34_14200 [Rhodobacteraceae bacterium PARR1]
MLRRGSRMVRISAMAAVAVLGMLSGAAGAQSRNCSDPQNQMEMNFCAKQDWQDQDARLNAEYKRAMTRAKAFDAEASAGLGGAAAALKTAQRAWIPFRDGNCAAEAFTMKGGSAEPLVYFGCMAAMTATRADELAVWLDYY